MGMKRAQFVRRLRKYCRNRNLTVSVDAARGKGSHVTLRVADRRAALVSAVDCLEEALAARIKARDPLPAPGPARGRPTVAPGSLIGAKAAFYLALKESGVKPAELARRMGAQPSLVTRLLDPAHATKPDLFDAAFAALGKRLVVSVENAA